MKNTLLIFCLAMFIVSCEKADYDELCPEETTLQSRTAEANDTTETTTLDINIETEEWGETVNVRF